MDSEKLDAEFAKTTQTFRYSSPEILETAKLYFEQNLHGLGKHKLELTAITDANIVLKEGISLVRNGKSSLVSISQSPFFRVIAPPWLDTELERKIPEVAKEAQVNEAQLREAIQGIIPHIHRVEVTDEAYARAIGLLGSRDPDHKDAPYVALYLSMNADGIISDDKDIRDQPNIKTWRKVGSVGKIVSTFERGSLSFVILGQGLPMVLHMLYELSIIILNAIWAVLKTLGELLMSIAAAGIAALSELPDWALLLIGAAVIIAIFVDDAKKWIVRNILEPLRSIIMKALSEIYDIIKSFINGLQPLVNISTDTAAYLLNQVGDAMTYYNEIDLDISAS